MIGVDFSNLYRIFMWFKVTVLYTFVFSIGFCNVHILKRAKKKCNVFIQDNLYFVSDIHQQMFI